MILVCFAVKEEAAPYKKLAAGCPTVRAVVSGMGRAAAERAMLQEFEPVRPELVLTCGFAGALAPELQTGDVLFECDPDFPLLVKLRTAGARPGRFYCSTEVLTTASAKAAARQTTEAEAVEMESGWIRGLCKAQAVPCATVRVILDPANMDLPVNFNDIMGPDQKIKPGKLTGAILRDPALVPRLLGLGKLSRKAADALADVLWKATAP